MSIDMLRNAENDRHHTFQDDMESLLYVVLYCGLLWLPHSLPKRQLAMVISFLFEYSDMLDIGRVGGNGKVLNACHCIHSVLAAFPSDLQDWLQTVMEFHRPIAHSEEEYGDRWTNPNHLDDFWGDYLKTHVLNRDDRVVHDHPHATGVLRSASSTASTEAILLPTRTSEQLTASPPRKRARQTPPYPADSDDRVVHDHPRAAGVLEPTASTKTTEAILLQTRSSEPEQRVVSPPRKKARQTVDAAMAKLRRSTRLEEQAERELAESSSSKGNVPKPPKKTAASRRRTRHSKAVSRNK